MVCSLHGLRSPCSGVLPMGSVRSPPIVASDSDHDQVDSVLGSVVDSRFADERSPVAFPIGSDWELGLVHRGGC